MQQRARSVAAASLSGAAAFACGVALVALATSATPAPARILRVDTGASAAAAVARAAAGDTVLLAAGSFKETIAIPRGVCLRGAGVGRTVLTYPGNEVVRVSGGSGEARGSGSAGSVASPAALIALTVRDARTGIAVDGADLRVASCHIEDCEEVGVRVRGPARVELANDVLEGNDVAVLAREGAELRIHDSEIRGSEVGLDVDGAAIEVAASSLTGNQLGAVVRDAGRLVLGDRAGAGNRIYKNRQGTVRNLTSIPVRARYNYWGTLDCAFTRGFTGPVTYLPFMNLALDDSVAACP